MKDLGRQLRRLLTPRALLAWCGTDRLSALAEPARRAAMRELTPAAAPLAVFIAGTEVPVSLVERTLDLETLVHHGLVEIAGDRVRATLSLLPLGSSLLACDRLDAAPTDDVVMWPDDSSYHLALSVPPGESWLDLACGSAFAPLWRHQPAVIADVNDRALARAALGGMLSDVALEPYTADVMDGVPLRAWDVISCNAPIPDDAGPMWRATSLAFFEKLFAETAFARLVVIHAAERALAPLADLPGEKVVVAYTPEPGFAVAWWQPAADRRYVHARRPLTDDRPHVTFEDRAAALC
ncbi:MAG: hypothetical protein JO257_17900 [Deltaproteobacteria bacterium]|nr:hypothetical protein [Deltaproteobacteria bacterium]